MLWKSGNISFLHSISRCILVRCISLVRTLECTLFMITLNTLRTIKNNVRRLHQRQRRHRRARKKSRRKKKRKKKKTKRARRANNTVNIAAIKRLQSHGFDSKQQIFYGYLVFMIFCAFHNVYAKNKEKNATRKKIIEINI